MNRWKKYYRNEKNKIEIPKSPFDKLRTASFDRHLDSARCPKGKKEFLSREWINIAAMIILIAGFYVSIPTLAEYRTPLVDYDISKEDIKAALPAEIIHAGKFIILKTAKDLRL